jgi:hypothetical protein
MRTPILRLLTILAAAAALPMVAAAQVIEVTPQVHDFGRMKQQESKTVVLSVKNQGAGRLVIEKVEPDCGCTVAEMTVKELAPGESTDLTIEFNSKKFAGKVVKNVQIFSNDPRNPVVDVMFTADVHAPLLIDPVSQKLGFEIALQGKTEQKFVTFTATEIPELKISVAGTRKDVFDVKVVNGFSGDPRKAALQVTLPKDMPVGKHRDNVRVMTNVPDMETVDIELSTWINSPLAATPEEVNFRYKTEFDQNVRVRAFRPELTFNVTGVSTDLPEITAEIVHVTPGAETIIKISGKPIARDDPRAVAANGRIQGKLIVKTDRADMPLVEVPILYMVKM